MFPSVAAAEGQLTCLVTESYNKSAETQPLSQSPWLAPSFPAPSDLMPPASALCRATWALLGGHTGLRCDVGACDKLLALSSKRPLW